MTKAKANLKTILLGLDGATFDVIRPLVQQGKLTHLGRLMRDGAHGTLQSIVPPITGPAWSVLATGKNPGRLGVYDFLNRREADDYRLYPIRSGALAGQAFWDVLSRSGQRVGILNYPMLVPAYPIEGWMIAGLGASRLQEYAYPATLKQELDDVTGGYQISLSYGLPKYRGNLRLLVADMKRLVQQRVAAMAHLLATSPVDALVIVFSVPDIASHTMWEYWLADEATTARDPFVAEMKAAYVEIWQLVDEAVGSVLAHLAPDGHALVVSDHGFGTSYGVFHINQWLEQAGYLVRKQAGATAGNRLRKWLVEQTQPFLGGLYKRMLGSKAHHLLRASVAREIDLERSLAFALDSSDGCGGIYVNRQYARQQGLDGKQFLHDTASRLRKELLSFGRQQGLEMELAAAEQLYSGDKVDLAPELMLTVENGRCSVSYRFEEPVYAARRHHPMKSGTHRMEGVLLATGPKIQPGIIHGAGLQDVAPTLLSLAGAPLPADRDGRVLTELLRPDAAAAALEAKNMDMERIDTAEAEDEDTSAMLERLAELGYLE